MVKQQVGQRTPLSAITNTKTNSKTESSDLSTKKNINYQSDRENRVLIDKNNNSIDDSLDLGKKLDPGHVLVNLEDSSSSSCGLNNSSSINITSSTISSSISNNSNKTQKSKKKVQFISNEDLDNKTELTNDNNKYNKFKLNQNTLPVNTNYANISSYKHARPTINHKIFTQSKPINFLSSSTTYKPFMSYSNTMPSISTVLTNQYVKTNHSSYAICDSDNPFRPEGHLAKEADEFVKELNSKKEREVNEIIKNTSLNNSASLSVSELIQQPNDAELAKTANEPVSSPAKKSDVVSLPEPRSPKKGTEPVESKTEPTPAENEVKDKKKNKKVKSKCGCTIS